VDEVWLVAPNFSPMVFSLHWLDVVVPLGLVGIWFSVFLFYWREGPDLPRGHHSQVAHYDV